MVEEYLIYCPMMKKDIDTAYCVELQMIADNEVKPTKDEEHLSNDDYAVCLKCKRFNNPF